MKEASLTANDLVLPCGGYEYQAAIWVRLVDAFT